MRDVANADVPDGVADEDAGPERAGELVERPGDDRDDERGPHGPMAGARVRGAERPAACDFEEDVDIHEHERRVLHREADERDAVDGGDGLEVREGREVVGDDPEEQIKHARQRHDHGARLHGVCEVQQKHVDRHERHRHAVKDDPVEVQRVHLLVAERVEHKRPEAAEHEARAREAELERGVGQAGRVEEREEAHDEAGEGGDGFVGKGESVGLRLPELVLALARHVH